MRALSDLALMLRDSETALGTLRLLASDFKQDKAWKHYAAVQVGARAGPARVAGAFGWNQWPRVRWASSDVCGLVSQLQLLLAALTAQPGSNSRGRPQSSESPSVCCPGPPCRAPLVPPFTGGPWCGHHPGRRQPGGCHRQLQGGLLSLPTGGCCSAERCSIREPGWGNRLVQWLPYGSAWARQKRASFFLH